MTTPDNWRKRFDPRVTLGRFALWCYRLPDFVSPRVQFWRLRDGFKVDAFRYTLMICYRQELR